MFQMAMTRTRPTWPEFDRELGPTRTQLLQLRGFTLREVARQYRVSPETVATWFRDYGIRRERIHRNRYSRPPQQPPPPRPADPPPLPPPSTGGPAPFGKEERP